MIEALIQASLHLNIELNVMGMVVYREDSIVIRGGGGGGGRRVMPVSSSHQSVGGYRRPASQCGQSAGDTLVWRTQSSTTSDALPQSEMGPG